MNLRRRMTFHEAFFWSSAAFLCLCIIAGVDASSRSSRRARCNLTMVREHHQRTHCQPIVQPVPFMLPSPYTSRAKSVALVKRCYGMACQRPGFTCEPIRTSNVTIVVEAAPKKARRRVRCVPVPVVQHEECECRCVNTCSSNQRFNEALCMCGCNREMRERCEEKGRLWDESKCQCICPHYLVSKCSTGQVYMHEICRCISL